MIYTILTMKNSDNDQLASVSAVADASGNLVSKTLFHPWGTTRYSQGTNPTDYAYTGQMHEGDIYFYNARWYDPQLGRFIQADTIVPPIQGTQGFDRYAYVNNNPPRYYDAEGEYACDVNGNCFVEGWSASYNRVQSGNTCAVNSCAIALSILQGTNITQEEMLPHFPLTQNRDIGVPAWQQALVVDWAFPKVGVDYTKLNKQGIILNLKTDKPVIVTFALPLEMDFSGQRWAGHSVTAIGYQANLNQIIFFNTATGMIELENDMVHNYGELVASNFPLSISSKYDFSNFTSLQRNHNFFVGPYDAVVMYLSGFSNYYPIQGSGSLAAYRRMTR